MLQLKSLNLGSSPTSTQLPRIPSHISEETESESNYSDSEDVYHAPKKQRYQSLTPKEVAK